MSAPSTNDVAELSRGQHGAWKAKRNGKHGGVVQRPHSCVNWYHPFLWTHINQMAPRAGWLPHFIVVILQHENPSLFSTLHRGTVGKWLSKNNNRRWLTATLKNVERQHALAGTGRVGVLSPYPEVVAEVKTKLKDLGTSGIFINCLLARSILLAVIKERKEDLLKTFKCSEVSEVRSTQLTSHKLTSTLLQHYVGQFLESVMNWTVRQGTQAAAHIPDDAPSLCERALFRLVHLIFYYDIPPHLLINMDQTGILMLMSKNKTYAEKGSRQVDIAGKDEKRAYTLCVATTPSGNILPFQQVWSGETR